MAVVLSLGAGCRQAAARAARIGPEPRGPESRRAWHVGEARPRGGALSASLKDTLAAEARADVLGALLGYQALLSQVRPAHELSYLDQRLRGFVGGLSESQVSAAIVRFAAGTRVRGLLVARQAQLQIAAGREDKARALLRGAGSGLTPAEGRAILARAGEPTRIGALIPLSGGLGALGRELLSGMLLASDLSGRSRGTSATVVVRDSARDPVAGVEALARLGAVALVGVPRSSQARKAAPRCQQLGLALLTGADGAGVATLGTAIFRAVHSPVQRARALAAHLSATRKVQRVAVVHPDNGYGRRVGAAFAAEATRRKLTVAATVAYRRSDTTLYKQFQPLVAKGVQAVFVADSAVRLELVAPQLALAGLQAASTARLGRGKVLLLSTAEGLRSRLVKNVAHAVAGAILAPGYYPDAADPVLGGFVAAFTKVFGHPPGRYAALGYLAVQRIRGLLVRKAWGRVSLVRALRAQRDAKARPIFDKNGERADAPRLYQVHPSGIRRIR
ncbi:MAG: ABC transporter substrate-binding protein [bacterium]